MSLQIWYFADHSNRRHLVLFYNLAVLILMLFRRLPETLGKALSHCLPWIFCLWSLTQISISLPESRNAESLKCISCIISLFSHAHVVDDAPPEARDPPVPSPRLGISESVHFAWPHVAELWFLGMQSMAFIFICFLSYFRISLILCIWAYVIFWQLCLMWSACTRALLQPYWSLDGYHLSSECFQTLKARISYSASFLLHALMLDKFID